MDWLVGRFAQARLANMTAEELAQFERALIIPDPALHDMILYPSMAPAGEFAELISQIRAFHGLE
jgi:antitoxin CptB